MKITTILLLFCLFLFIFIIFYIGLIINYTIKIQVTNKEKGSIIYINRFNKKSIYLKLMIVKKKIIYLFVFIHIYKGIDKNDH